MIGQFTYQQVLSQSGAIHFKIDIEHNIDKLKVVSEREFMWVLEIIKRIALIIILM